MNHNSIERFITYLLQCGISDTMMSIVEKQHISLDDLQIMDRDDVEHLFKNEYGFKFRDRKQFWNALRKFQSAQQIQTKHELLVHSPHLLEHIYEFAEKAEEEEEEEEEVENEGLKEQQSIESLSSDTSRQPTIMNVFDSQSSKRTCQNFKPSSFVTDLSSLSSDFVFTYPSMLPNFSTNIIEALQTNTIHKQWAVFINELARWVMSIKPCLREQHEYQAIGQTLYEKYPSIGTTGPKPWSFLCRSLSQRIRTERWQRRKSLATRKRKENHVKQM